MGARWHSGFMTYPSPDPVAGIESTGYLVDPVCFQAGWAGAPDTSPHDQWLYATHSTANDDLWPYPLYADKFGADSEFFARQTYFGSFREQSPGGDIKYESLEDATGSCLPYDDDYIDDVLSVMAKVANVSTTSVIGVA